MGFFDKAKGLISKNTDKVEDGIDKAADVVEEKVPEEHVDKVEMAADKAKDVVEGLADDE